MTRPCFSTGCGAQVRALDSTPKSPTATDTSPASLTADQRRQRIACAIDSYMRTNAATPERPRRRRAGRAAR